MTFKRGDLVTTTQKHCTMYETDEVPPGRTFKFWSVEEAATHCILELPGGERYRGAVQWEVPISSVSLAEPKPESISGSKPMNYDEIVKSVASLTPKELVRLRVDISTRLEERDNYIKFFPFTGLEMAALRAGGLLVQVIKSIRERDLSLSLKEAKDATDHYRRRHCNPSDGGFMQGDQ